MTQESADPEIGDINADPLLPPAFGGVEGKAVEKDEHDRRQQELGHQWMQSSPVEPLTHWRECLVFSQGQAAGIDVVAGGAFVEIVPYRVVGSVVPAP